LKNLLIGKHFCFVLKIDFGLQDLSGSEERFERSFLRENSRHITNLALSDTENTMVSKSNQIHFLLTLRKSKNFNMLTNRNNFS
jgi:hypothetical protein